MTVLRFVLLGYAIFAIFIAGGLFFKRNTIANQTAAAFVILFGIETFEFLYSTSNILKQYPTFFGIYYFPAGFLYGPLLYLHFRAVYLKDSGRSWNDLWHFLPSLIMIVLMMDIYAMAPIDRITYMRTHFLDRIMPYNYTRAIHLLVYGIWIIMFVYKNRVNMIPKEKLYGIAVCSIYFLSVVLISWLTWFADNWRQFIAFYFVAYTVVFIIAYLLYTDPEFLNKMSKKYLNSGLNDEDMKRIYEKIRLSFYKEKVFLQRDLTLSTISDLIEEKPHHISQTMSELVHKNFNDYLNFYRIEYAKDMLADQNFGHYKIEAIALESGFNNKVTFNKAFLKWTQSTPSIYRKEKLAV